MKHEPVILPTTDAVTTVSPATIAPVSGVATDINATEEDKVLLVLSGPATGGIVNPPAVAETILVFVPSTTGNVPVYDSAGVQAQLNSTKLSVMLEGGFIYRLVKTSSIAAFGCDVYLKPRR